MAEDNFRSVYEYATTPDEAKAAAKSQAKRIERSKRSATFTLPGRADIVAGAVIVAAQFRDAVNGRYKVIEVRHSVTRSGWSTSLTCEGAA
jgi:phage protein D